MCSEWSANVAHSSRGLGHLPLKEEITGSNPVCATNSCCHVGFPLRKFYLYPRVVTRGVPEHIRSDMYLNSL
jgi:hypothetical protein